VSLNLNLAPKGGPEIREVLMIGRGGNKKDAKREAAAAVLREVNKLLNSNKQGGKTNAYLCISFLSACRHVLNC
jgi:hypothetical protein